ncbi:MAG: M48 family metallopeptidase, partial [Kiritimatiellae bacterium]|nr:M48 family metallopeptidase [Kiritimatiellia bacterium]
MNFFQSQEHARRQTAQLVVYYALAVVLIIAGVYMAIALTFIGVSSQAQHATAEAPRLWNGELALGVTIGTLLIVLMGSVFKVIQLGKGGAAVAESLGAREVNPSTTNKDERKLRNIVEEMSIASGVPMPRIFVMDNEDGINAFAAGFSIDQAVVAVTSGCIQQLTRDELQGVIAHEFSHILNGDMRLNIRLMGVLNGILIIGMLGYFVMRMTLGGGRSSRSDKKGGAIPIAVMGLIIMAVGYIGVLFGKLIKAAVSRQREFLADASAVQFTRNPDGIANALKKIGGFDDGSRVQHAKAEQASHFFFANGVRQSFVGLFATHPPLEERIRRVDPAFDGELKANERDAAPAASAHEGLSGFAGASATPERIAVSAEQVVDRIGTPTPEHVAYARRLLDELPASLVDAAHEDFGSRAVVYALLLDRRDAIQSAQLTALQASADADVFAEVERLREA